MVLALNSYCVIRHSLYSHVSGSNYVSFFVFLFFFLSISSGSVKKQEKRSRRKAAPRETNEDIRTFFPVTGRRRTSAQKKVLHHD